MKSDLRGQAVWACDRMGVWATEGESSSVAPIRPYAHTLTEV
jgi:hypothetical protein